MDQDRQVRKSKDDLETVLELEDCEERSDPGTARYIF